jgi:hypothetical protein
MRAILFIFAVVSAGCAAQSAKYAGVEPEVRKAALSKTIRFASVPTGCIVEINGEYIGQTPFSLTVDADNNGCWPRYYPGGGTRTFSNNFVCTTPNGFSEPPVLDCRRQDPGHGAFSPIPQLSRAADPSTRIELRIMNTPDEILNSHPDYDSRSPVC